MLGEGRPRLIYNNPSFDYRHDPIFLPKPHGLAKPDDSLRHAANRDNGFCRRYSRPPLCSDAACKGKSRRYPTDRFSLRQTYPQGGYLPMSNSKLSSVFYESSRQARGFVQTLLTERHDSLDWIDDLRDLQHGYLQKSTTRDQRECSAGCSTCCLTAAVDVTGIEAIAVRDFLKSHLDGETVAQIKNRLQKVTQRRIDQMRGLAPQRPVACSMLGEDGKCQIYAARPLICSGVFSTNRQACLDAGESAQNGDISGTVPLDLDAIQATGGISGTLQRVLVENGLDGNLYELNSAILEVFDLPNALGRYLAGEDIFHKAICTDAHSAPRRNMVLKPHHLKRRAARSA